MMKNLRNTINRYGVKREDFYQMYAYLNRYKEAKTAILLYPRDAKDTYDEFLQSWYLEEDRDKKIRIYSVDIYEEHNTINTLKNIIEKNI